MAHIELRHLKKIYPNGVLAVKDFSLSIEESEFVVFVGPSGCGKSTVLRMIAGLEEITDGELIIDGKVMNDEEPKNRNIAMVFQNYALYPHLSVRNNIGFPLFNERVPFKHFFDFKYRAKRKKEINALVSDIAKSLNLSEYLDRKPKNLSGGQRQRVALGRAIIRNPVAFLLDEPLSNLDAKMRTSMRTEISRLHNELKTTFIYVTHDQIEALTMGTKIVVLKDGVIQQVAGPTELFMNPINKFVAGFIGTPQMNFLDAKLEGNNQEVKALFNQTNEVTLGETTKKIPSNYLGKEVIMGLRPRAISVDYENKSPIKAVITLSEKLGDETILYMKLVGNGAEIICYDSGKVDLKLNQEVSLNFCLDNVVFFDKDTEYSIYE